MTKKRGSKSRRSLNSPPTLGVQAKISKRRTWYQKWLDRLVEFLSKWLKFQSRTPSVIDPVPSEEVQADNIIGEEGVKEVQADDIIGVKRVEEVQADDIIGVVKEVQVEAAEVQVEVGQAAKEAQIIHERQQVGQAIKKVGQAAKKAGQAAQIVHERQQVGQATKKVGQTAQIVHERQQVGQAAKNVGEAAQIVAKRHIAHERQRNSRRYISYTNTRAWARIPSNALNHTFIPAQYSIHLQFHGLFEDKDIHQYDYPSEESLEISELDPALRKRMKKAYVDISQDNIIYISTCIRAWGKHGRWFGVSPGKYFEMAMDANDMFNRDNSGLGESISPPAGLSFEEMRVGHVTGQRLSDILYDALECEFKIVHSGIDSESEYLTDMPPGAYRSFDGIDINLDGANQPKRRRPRLKQKFASTMLLL